MSDQYLQELGIDGYLLEDSSGILLIDQRIINKASTVGITEDTNKSWVKAILNNVGITDAVNLGTGFVKVAAQAILGLVETKNTTITQWDYLLEDGTGFGYLTEDGAGIYIQDYPLINISSTVGITETSQRTGGLLQNILSTIGLTDESPVITNIIFGIFKVVTSSLVSVESAVNKLLTNVNFYALESGLGVYQLEESTGRYEFDQLAILQSISNTVGVTEASQRFLGPIKHISDTVGLTEAITRAMVMFRNTTSESVGITETLNRLGNLTRNLAETVGLTEASNRLGGLVRNLASTVGLTEASNHIRGLLKNLADTVGITETINEVSGIVKYISETIGLTEASNKIRSVFISVNLGNFIATAAINLSNFYALAGHDLSDMTVIDSYNIENLTIIDDN